MKLKGVVSVLSMLGMVLGAAASAAPLVVNLSGDLWSWSFEKGWTQLTTSGHNGPPVLSPDGRRVAFASLAQGADAPRFPNDPWGTPPTNIWTLDLTTLKAEALTMQPPEVPGRGGLVRSTPVWSPDGRFLAWTQFTSGEPPKVQTVTTYYPANEVTQVARTDVPSPPRPSGVLWSSTDLIVLGGSAGSATNAYVVDMTGETLRTLPLPGPVHHLVRSGGSVFLTDTSAKTLVRVAGRGDAPKSSTFVKRLVSLSAPGGLSVGFIKRDSALVCGLVRGERVVREWTCPERTNEFSFFAQTFQVAFTVAISPDGRNVAYLRDRAIVVHDGVNERTVLELGAREVYGMTWGNVEFRVP